MLAHSSSGLKVYGTIPCTNPVGKRFLWLHRTITHTAWRSRPPRQWLTDCSTCAVCACDLLPAQVIGPPPFRMKAHHPVRDRASGPSQNDESIQTPIAVNALSLLAHSSSGLKVQWGCVICWASRQCLMRGPVDTCPCKLTAHHTIRNPGVWRLVDCDRRSFHLGRTLCVSLPWCVLGRVCATFRSDPQLTNTVKI